MKFYIVKDGMRQGPYEVEELVQQQLSPDTLVWTTGMPDWVEARQVPELKDAIAGGDGIPPELPLSAPIGQVMPPEFPESRLPETPYNAPVEPAGQPVPLPRPAHAPVEVEEPVRRNSKGWVWLVAAIAVLALLLFTRPDRKDHIGSITTACEQYAHEAIDNSLLGGMSITSDGGKWLTSKVIDEFVDYHLSLHDYFILNVGKMELNGDKKTVSVGILGHVFTFDKEDVAKAVEKYLQEEASKQSITDETTIEGVLNHAQKAVEEVVGKIRIDTTAINEGIDSLTNKVTDAMTRKAKDALGEAIDGLVDEIGKQLGGDGDQ